jgi:hypothetical protein
MKRNNKDKPVSKQLNLNLNSQPNEEDKAD